MGSGKNHDIISDIYPGPLAGEQYQQHGAYPEPFQGNHSELLINSLDMESYMSLSAHTVLISHSTFHRLRARCADMPGSLSF